MPITPTPQRQRVLEGAFQLQTPITLTAAGSGTEAEAEVCRLGEALHALNVQWTETGADQATIRLQIDPDAAADLTESANDAEPGNAASHEAYDLSIQPDRITLRGRTPAGLAHAVTSLLQLLLDAEVAAAPSTANGITTRATTPQLTAMTISDAPRFGWRGMHLDIARHFFDVASIKRYVDWLALHKFNVLHLHLTDDQGWRFESRQYPRLTEVGAWRERTAEPRRGEPGDESPHGGYLTQAACRDLVQYAAARHITVVPEIELPGHAKAALAAYPELSCTSAADTHAVWPHWGVCEDVFCVGNEKTFRMLRDVLEEVVAVFPGPFIHVGGDEVPKTRWTHCETCRQRMAERNLPDENALQGWFISRINGVLTQHGRRMIGWDDILDSDLPSETVIMNWRQPERAATAAARGHQVIRVNQAHCYFNYRPAATLFGPGHDQVLDLPTVYRWEPTADLDPDAVDQVIGGQGCLWTEYVPTLAELEYLLLPRLGALAECLWTRPDQRDWARFEAQLPDYLHQLRTWRRRTPAARPRRPARISP